MIIKAIQLQQMEAVAFQRFIKKITEQIFKDNPNWRSFDTMGAKEVYVRSIVIYGQKCNIAAHDNLGKFVQYIVDFKKNIPLSQEIEIELKQPKRREEERLEAFYLKLANARQQLVLIEI